MLSFLQPGIVARLTSLQTIYKIHMLVHCIIKPCPVHDILFLLQTSYTAIQYAEVEISNQSSLFNINLWIVKLLPLIWNL